MRAAVLAQVLREQHRIAAERAEQNEPGLAAEDRQGRRACDGEKVPNGFE
jgi:hypothetical protein